MQPITCHECGTRVLVEKYSEIHTSVQWLEDAEAACPEFARLAEQGTHSAFVSTCMALRRSIGAAVREGRVPESRFSEPAPLPTEGR
ncbi:hypothetical protein [Streptomyces triticisoli]|jgi:hypothetical protein|uniref:hypothetical protein n=1 Tax=Streptomyces triticisoli TaxID=2182797 RepID=UPI000DDBE8C1|nr:hypothetical protein [Streptomyces triticisoli]